MNNFFGKEDFIRKSIKTALLTKYIHICTSHHQLHIQTLYIVQKEVLTMDINKDVKPKFKIFKSILK